MSAAHEPLVVIDVGARGKPPPAVRRLGGARIVAFEPEPEEAARLERELRSEDHPDVTVLPLALGSGRTATLHVTRNPGFSSTYRPTALLARFVPEVDVVRELEVATVRLDDAATAHGFGDATLIKLDTQGSELEILESGPGVVEAAVAVAVEVSFDHFYDGAPLFGEVDSHLRDRGYRLIELRRARLRPLDARAGLGSIPELVWAHCLYVRDPQRLDDRRRGRLARVALAYGYVDLASALADGTCLESQVERRGRRLAARLGDPGTRIWKDR